MFIHVPWFQDTMHLGKTPNVVGYYHWKQNTFTRKKGQKVFSFITPKRTLKTTVDMICNTDNEYWCWHVFSILHAELVITWSRYYMLVWRMTHILHVDPDTICWSYFYYPDTTCWSVLLSRWLIAGLISDADTVCWSDL